MPKQKLLLVLAGLALATASIITSQALFTSSSDNPQTADGDHINRWLNLYSQSTDPDGLTGYAVRNGSSPSVPAASSSNENLTVHLGEYNNVGSTNIARVFTAKAPASFPEGITSITATITRVADAGGQQPLTNAVFTNSTGGSANATKTFSPGTKFQIRATVRTNNISPNGVLYTPKIRITVTFTGFTATFLQYSIPVKIYDGTGPGPD